jgi:hypothetical protein
VCACVTSCKLSGSRRTASCGTRSAMQTAAGSQPSRASMGKRQRPRCLRRGALCRSQRRAPTSRTNPREHRLPITVESRAIDEPLEAQERSAPTRTPWWGHAQPALRIAVSAVEALAASEVPGDRMRKPSQDEIGLIHEVGYWARAIRRWSHLANKRNSLICSMVPARGAVADARTIR